MTISIENIRILPAPALRLIGTSRKDLEILKKDLKEILGKDRFLSARFLRLVNSSYFSFPQQIGSIQEAVMLGDPAGFRNLLLCALVANAVHSCRSRAAFHAGEYLWHSLECAILAKETAARVHYPFPEDAFLVGYLHDIGKLILLEALGEKYDVLLEICRFAPDLLLESELRLGGTHSQLAASFLGYCSLPSYLTDPILYHHESEERVADALPLVRIVYVAHSMCGEPDPTARFRVAEELLGLKRNAVLETLKDSKEKTRKLAEYLELGAGPRPVSVQGHDQEGLEAEKAVALRARDALFFMEAIDHFLGRREGEPIVRILLEGIKKVFGTPHLLVFQMQSQQKVLQGRMLDEGGNLVLVEDLSIPLKSEKSLIVRALTEETFLTSFDPASREGPILSDEQIARFLGKPDILCLGMSDRDGPLGVMVIGMDSKDFPSIRDRMQLLRLMLRHAALLLRLEEVQKNHSSARQKEETQPTSAIPRDVYHEVNNPLGIIKNYLKILSIKLSDRQIAQEEIEIINEEIDRITKILRERAEPVRSDAARGHFSRLAPIDVNGLIADLLTIAKASAEDSGIDLVLHVERSLPFALAEKDGLKQVLINLLKNALDAMPKGGKLQIQTCHVQGSSEKNGQGFVEITFRDSGPGVAEEMKHRLFEPFVTSKGENHSGLGLSISQNILKGMDGLITYEEGAERGSVFRIRLPAAMNQTPLQASNQAPP
jgi:signal transduction histidine kinase